MIKSFKHKGLEKFFTTGNRKGIQPAHAKKLELLLTALNVATRAGQLDQDGWYFHPLKHEGVDIYSLKVSGNWRVTFRFSGTDAEIVDYVDYH